MITQKDFDSIYTTYVDYLENKCEYVCNTNIQAVSTYVKNTFGVDHCMWEVTNEKIKDIYGNDLHMWKIENYSFVVFRWEETTLFDIVGEKIRSRNSVYNEPRKFENESFYNYDDELIYYSSPKDFNYLLEQYSQEVELKKQWDEFNKIKHDLSETNYLPLPEMIADHFLNCLPPVEFIRGAFLAGEAWKHNKQGYALYLEVRNTSKDNYECKLSTHKEFKKRYKC